jgi:ribonuclease HII
MAAAVVFPQWSRRPRDLAGLTDSKQLSRQEREIFSARIRAHGKVGLGAASRREIDRINIHNATLLAMTRAYRHLGVAADLALVDGVHAPALPCPVETVVKGDSLSLSIAAASVVAKVVRDRLMERLSCRYPGYGWETNAGYGADTHYAGLLRLGITPHHRLGFSPVREVTDGLFVRGFRYERLDRATPGIEIVPLRSDFHAVFDGARCHVGFLKALRRIWRFEAVGYDAAGRPLASSGPYASCHEKTVDDPRPVPLESLLRGVMEAV